MAEPTPDQTSVVSTALALDDHLAHHVVGAGDHRARLGRIVGDALAAEERRVEDAGHDRADDAADAVDAEHVERVVIAELAPSPW